MHSSRFSPFSFWMLLAAAGAAVLPDEMQGAFRSLMGDLVKPGCAAWTEAGQRIASMKSKWAVAPVDPDPEIRRLQSELDAAMALLRKRELQLARLQEEAAANRSPLFVQTSEQPPERLAQPLLVEVGVLGAGHAAAWRKGRWLDQGKATGLIEEAPVLASAQSLLDVGRDVRLSAEDAVLSGRSVIGKVAQVGRWTSTFLLVTDAEYRGRAQLVREAGDGYVFGAKGIMKGQGEPLCRLEGVPAAEMVDVGDAVYTADRDGLLPTPLYYGKVVEATLPDRAREWRILVQPAERPNDLTTVQVLRSALNPRRVAAN